MEGVQLVLENKSFFFKNQYYIQSNGAARSTRVTLTLTTLVIGYVEEKKSTSYCAFILVAKLPLLSNGKLKKILR